MSSFVFCEEDDEEIHCDDKMYNFAENIVPHMSDGQFQMHFRMNPTTFEYLLYRVYAVATFEVKTGQPQLPLDKQLMMTVWYLANLESIRSVANRFGVSKATCWSSVYRASKLILEVNKRFKIIGWPSGARANTIINNFHLQHSLPGVVGVIDSTHIPINAPKNHRMSYFNRKFYFSLILQGVCDNSKMFIDVYTGQPGSVHDAHVFKKSDLYRRITNNEIEFPNDFHLIGDLAYPLSRKLLVAFKNNRVLTPSEKNFNLILSKTRAIIENAFALLKGRFRRLKYLETVQLDLACLLITTGCILHNVCIFKADLLDHIINMEEEIRELHLYNEEDMENNQRDITNPEPIEKRNRIVNSLPLIQ